MNEVLDTLDAFGVDSGMSLKKNHLREIILKTVPKPVNCVKRR